MTRDAAAGVTGSGPVTISHILGELTWLFTQSERHNSLPLRELTWQLMPAIVRRQFHLFHENDRPLGAVIWALLSQEDERRLIAGEFFPPHVTEEAWSGGDRLWIIDLIAPFADDMNKQRDVMFADLVTGIFKGRSFKMLVVDPHTLDRKVVEIDGLMGDRLTAHLKDLPL